LIIHHEGHEENEEKSIAIDQNEIAVVVNNRWVHCCKHLFYAIKTCAQRSVVSFMLFMVEINN
jgi:hypothetical protein